jgi:hypothetical protein
MTNEENKKTEERSSVFFVDEPCEGYIAFIGQPSQGCSIS